MPESPADLDNRPIAVAIPCYNEAAAIGPLLARWRSALPEAEIVVFDNNSTDGTGVLAREHGARVVLVADRGKGYVVRAIFKQLGDRELVVLTDGDGTYPPEAVGKLLEPVRAGLAEMTVGARRPLAGAGAMSPVRGLGNLLIRSAFAVLIGRGPGDLLSGYRVFSNRFLQEVQPRSRGFEIEAELAALAVARAYRVVEVPVDYHPRAAGTASKLRAVQDGLRIIAMIAAQGLRLRPWRGLGIGLLAALLGVLAWGLARR